MKTSYLILSLFIVLMACNKEETPNTKSADFSHDTYTAGGTANYQAGFEKDEIAASSFGPLVNPFTVESVSLLFGGSTETRNVIVNIYNDNGTANPGSKVFSKTFSLVGSDNLQTIDLSGEDIRFEKGSFRVGIQMTKAGVPSIATDDNSDYKANKNWVKVNTLGTWKATTTLSISGNWILRASVKEEV